MKIACSQPTFLSYPGYFGLIDYVDKFVIMDSIQVSYRSWQQRALIKINKIPQYLTIPILKKQIKSKIISDVQIDISSDYIKDHLLTIKHSYSKYRFFKNYYPKIEKIYNNNFTNLIDLNISFIHFINEVLDIDNKKIIYLSNLNIDNQFTKDNLIYQICSKIKHTKEYISTEGARNYLQDNRILNDNFKIKYFTYEHTGNRPIIYQNKHVHLSIIDMIFTYGKKTKEIINSNFKIKKD
tara:strand:- start:139 stop:855 length:717 start_codon:yes stop_codon:yes gene_type:complete